MKATDADAIMRAVADWAMNREDIRALSLDRVREAIRIKVRT